MNKQAEFDPLVILDAVIKRASMNTARKNRDLVKAVKRGTGIIGASSGAAMALQLEQGLQQTRVAFDVLMAAVRAEVMDAFYERSDLERAATRKALTDAYLAAGGKL